MKSFKKIITIFTILSLVFASSINSFAATNSDSRTSTQVGYVKVTNVPTGSTGKSSSITLSGTSTYITYVATPTGEFGPNETIYMTILSGSSIVDIIQLDYADGASHTKSIPSLKSGTYTAKFHSGTTEMIAVTVRFWN